MHSCQNIYITSCRGVVYYIIPDRLQYAGVAVPYIKRTFQFGCRDISAVWSSVNLIRTLPCPFNLYSIASQQVSSLVIDSKSLSFMQSA